MGWPIWATRTYLFVHQSSPVFSTNVQGVVVDQVFFQMFDMSIRSRDIRDQNRKLSKIVPKFGRFLALPNFRRRAFPKLCARYHPYLAACRLEKFREDTPTSPEFIETHTFNFKPSFNFRDYILGGTLDVPGGLTKIASWFLHQGA